MGCCQRSAPSSQRRRDSSRVEWVSSYTLSWQYRELRRGMPRRRMPNIYGLSVALRDHRGKDL